MFEKKITYYIKRIHPGEYQILIHGPEVGIKPGNTVMSDYRNYEIKNYYLRLYLNLEKNHKRKIRFTRQKLEKSEFYNEMILFDPTTSPDYTPLVAPFCWVYSVIEDRSKIWNSLVYNETMYPNNRGEEKSHKICLM